MDEWSKVASTSGITAASHLLCKTFKFHVKLQQLITACDCTLSTNFTAKYPSEKFDLEGQFISYTRFKESHESLKHFEVAEILSQFK